MALATTLIATACASSDDTTPVGPDTLRDTPPSTERTVSDAVLTLTLLDLGPDAEGGGGDALLVADSSGVRPWHGLVDAGDGPRALQALEAAGVDTLDLLVVTHAHYDHFGGAIPILESGIVVRRLLYNGQTRTNVTWQRFLSDADRALDVELASSVLDAGPVGGVEVTVLPPLTTYLANDTDDGQELNDGSLAVRLDLGSFSLLSTGDAEMEANARFGNQYPALVDVDVLKVGHHGSSDATSEGWLAQVTPEAALISANGTTHPHGSTLALLDAHVGVELFCTPQHGDITLRVAVDGRWAVRTTDDPRLPCQVGSEAF
jgi:beta-lactamase superfamily II metal-dependent hydrolase